MIPFRVGEETGEISTDDLFSLMKVGSENDTLEMVVKNALEGNYHDRIKQTATYLNGFLEKGEMVWESDQTSEPLNKSLVAEMDWEGWNRVQETNGLAREWDNGRIVDGFMTSDDYDSSNDRIHLSSFLLNKTKTGETRIDWIAKNGVISLVHGLTNLGFVPLGKILAWKHEGNKIKIRVGINKGSEMVDYLWENYISKADDEAGFSVGGQNLEKSCTYDTDGTKKCDITKVDVWEVAWTPSPANKTALIDDMNRMAKSDKIVSDYNIYIDKLQKTGTPQETGTQRTDEERLKEHFGDNWKEHTVDELPERGTGRQIQKDKTYLKPGEEPPKGVQVQTGKKGGKYYESKGNTVEEKPKKQSGIESRYQSVLSEKEEEKIDDQISDTIRAINYGREKEAVKLYNQVSKLLHNKDYSKELKEKYKKVRDKIEDEIPEKDLKKAIHKEGNKYCVECGGKEFGCSDTKEGAEEHLKAIQVNKSNLIKAMMSYFDDCTKNNKQPVTKVTELLKHCPHCESMIKTLENAGGKLLNTLDTVQSIVDETFIKSQVCNCIECGFTTMIGNDQRCLSERCPLCDGDMHTMVRPSMKSGGKMEVKVVEKADPELEPEKEKEPEPPKKEEVEKSDEEPAPKKEDEEEEEMSNKSLTKAVLEIKKTLESQTLLFKDLQESLKKDETHDEEENKITNDPGSGSGDPAPGGDVSGKSKTSMTVPDAIKVLQKSGIVVNGISVGTPQIKPEIKIQAPAGVEMLQKTDKKSIVDKVKDKLEFYKGHYPAKNPN